MNEKPYFSLAIEKTSKEALDLLTNKHALSQSEVIEVLLDASARLSDLLENDFDSKKEQKSASRNEIRAKKSSLRKAIAKISPDEMERILKDKGLIAN